MMIESNGEPMNSFKKSTLSTVCQRAMIALFATGVTSNVYAQQEQSKGSETEDIEVIEVQGSRDALAKALDRKRESSSVVDAIIAEDIGKMPDENIAEALQRITGVSIQRDMGEGSSVVVRGMNGDFNQIKVNGQTLTSGGNGRDVDFSGMSADLLSAIEVVKTPSANQDEGSIGATINLKTRKPLDSKKDQVMNFNFKQAYSEVSGEFDPNVAFNITRNIDNKFGVAASLTLEQRHARQDTYFTRSWRPFLLSEIRTSDVVGQDQLFTPESKEQSLQNIANDSNGIGWHPDEFGMRLDLQKRQRVGATFNFQYRPSDDTDMMVDMTYSRFNREQTFHQNWYKFRYNPGLVSNISVDEYGTMLSGDFLNTPNSCLLQGETLTLPETCANNERYKFAGQQTTSRSDRRGETDTENYLIGFSIEHRFDNITVSAKTGYSATREENLNESQFLFAQNNSTHGFKVIDENLIEIVAAGDNFVAPETNPHSVSQIRDNVRFVTDDNYYAQIDFDMLLDGDVFTAFKLGAKWTDRTKNKEDDSTYIRMWLEDIENSDKIRSSFINADNVPVFPVDDFMEGRGSDSMIRSWGVIDFDNAISNAAGVFGVDNFDELPFSKYRDYRNSYDLNIETRAVYAMLDIDTFDGRLLGNVGVRYVETIRTAVGYKGNQAQIKEYRPGLDNYANMPVIDYRDVQVEKVYDNVLPSFNLRYALTEDSLVRLSGATTMARPNFWEIAPYVKAQPLIDPARMWAGNPNLDPYESNQIDLTYEWYFDKGAMLSTALYYKDMSKFFYYAITDGVTHDPETNEPFWLDEEGVPVPFESNRPENGAGGSIGGIETQWQQNFTFLPGAWKNLGTLINYTYSDSIGDYIKNNLATSEEIRQLDLPYINQSKHSANAALYYETKGFRTRLAYTYRTESLLNPASRSGSLIWNDAYGQLDFSLGMGISNNMWFTFDIKNLTDEVQQRFVTAPDEGNALEVDVPRNRFYDMRQAGRIVRAGINIRF